MACFNSCEPYGECQAVNIRDNVVFFSDGNYVQIYNITDPLAPIKLSEKETPDSVLDIAVVDTLCFIANASSGFRILNVSDLENPIDIGSCLTNGSAKGVDIKGDFAFVADGDQGLTVVDITDLTHPRIHSCHFTNGFSVDVDVNGNTVYMADMDRGLNVFDISNINSIVQTEGLNTSYIPHWGNSTRGVTIKGLYAYVSNDSWGERIIDLSYEDTLIACFWDTTGNAIDVILDNNYAYWAVGQGIAIYDISTSPSNPPRMCDYRTPGMAWDIAIRDTFAFIADGDSGLCIINVSDVTNPVKVNTIPTGN